MRDKTREDPLNELVNLREQVRVLKQRLDGISKCNEVEGDSGRFYCQSFQDAPVAVFVFRGEHIIDLNKETERIYALTGNQIKVNPYLSLIYEEDRDVVKMHFDTQLKSDSPLPPCIYRIICGKSQVKWVELRSMSFKGGDHPSVVCFQIDISERHKTAQNRELYQEHLEEMVKLRSVELKEALIQAEKANQVKDAFLQNMSHEFRTPIHHINSFSRLGLEKTEKLLAETDDDFIKNLSKYFHNINESSQNLFLFITNLFDLSILESRQAIYYLSKQNLSELFNIAINHCLQLQQEKKITLNLDKNIERQIAIECDQEWLLKVLKHILSNAIKFSPNGSRVNITLNYPEIETKVSENNLVKVSVSDQGIGIPENELEMVFEKFTQSSLTRDGAGGKGIGLAICKLIVEDHHGKIWIEKNPEDGVTTHFTLPIQQPDESERIFKKQKIKKEDSFNKIGFT
ncbi:PAS domain-containing sensor histidine kinase [bacterium]|nr:PAS domain-containing sensor histidine kinase [bacterium]